MDKNTYKKGLRNEAEGGIGSAMRKSQLKMETCFIGDYFYYFLSCFNEILHFFVLRFYVIKKLFEKSRRKRPLYTPELILEKRRNKFYQFVITPNL